MCTIFFLPINFHTQKRWYRLFNVICDYCSRLLNAFIRFFSCFIFLRFFFCCCWIVHSFWFSLSQFRSSRSFHVFGIQSVAITLRATKNTLFAFIEQSATMWANTFGIKCLHAKESIHIDTHSITSSFVSARYQLLYYVLVFLLYGIFYSFWWQNFSFNFLFFLFLNEKEEEERNESE